MIAKNFGFLSVVQVALAYGPGSFISPTSVARGLTDDSGLLTPDGDGPFLFTSGLANTFRVETFNITQTGSTSSYFIQGSQRWVSIKLLAGPGLAFSSLGFRATSDHTPLDLISGSFNSSSTLLDRIWSLGPTAVHVSCVKNGTQTATWERAGDSGVLVRGQKPGRTYKLVDKLPTTMYNLTFQTKIARGGAGWQVDAGLGGQGIWMFLTGNLPSSTTYANHNYSMFPANSIVVGAGFGPVNVTTLPGYNVATFALNKTIPENTWLNITTTSHAMSSYTVYIDSEPVVFLNTTAITYLPPPLPYFGNNTIGFGGWQDTAAYYRNVKVVDGDEVVVYKSSLKQRGVLAEYGVETSPYTVCLDGGKRDRLVWTGDFFWTARSLAVSTATWEYVRGTIDYVLDSAMYTGAIPTSNPMGISLAAGQVYDESTAADSLADYDLDFLNVVYDYYMRTGDLSFIKAKWTQIVKVMDFVASFVNPSTKLWAPGIVEKGATNGTTSTAMLAYTFNNVAKLATALGHKSLATSYAQTANTSASAVQTLLWNEDAGYFNTSLTSDAFAYIDLAWSIIAGIATPSQAASQLQHLEKLKYTIGYLADSTVNVEALLKVNATDEAHFLLNNLWGAMAKPSNYYSGGSWEYVYPDGTPGLNLFTSLAHGWGSGPTSILTHQVLGLTPVTPGYRTWSFAPLEFGLTRNSGVVPTPFGSIKASWKIDDKGKMVLEVTAPKGTTGKVVPPGSRDRTWACEGKSGLKGPIKVEGGKTVVIREE
ncbi:Six-hairpin glycosidase [Pseudohyphozyma bogoriensis]|nr:Six-hairpin glycosidase [Pseudohyphozyma bogoriensis]